VLTSGSGAYIFSGLPPGRYRVRVQRLGYLSSSVEVDLRASSAARFSVGLEIEPIALEPLTVLGDAAQPYVRTGSPNGGVTGVQRTVARLRQRDYIAGDVRELTAADVSQAVTLGEADLFRALQRVPGVNTRDDYTALLWTRGAPWT
jgi:hypothetical protein